MTARHLRFPQQESAQAAKQPCEPLALLSTRPKNGTKGWKSEQAA